MAIKKRTAEEKERRAKIRELLQMANIGSMDDIQSLFKEAISEFMENGLELEQDNELGYTIKTRIQTTVGMGTAAKRCAPASVMWKCLYRGTEKENLSRRC